MAINQNGCSTTKTPGQFQYETFTTKIKGQEVIRIQWDYRDLEGKLHTGIATSLDEAMKAAKDFGYNPS